MANCITRISAESKLTIAILCLLLIVPLGTAVQSSELNKGCHYIELTPDDWIRGMYWSRDENIFAVHLNLDAEIIETWATDSGEYLGQQKSINVPLQWENYEQGQTYMQIAWDPAGEYVAIGRDDTVNVYEDSELIFSIKGDNVALWSFDGSLLATSVQDGRSPTTIWDTQTWTTLYTIEEVNVAHISWHPTENRFSTINRYLVGSDNELGDVIVLNGEDGNIIDILKLPEEITDLPIQNEWSPDGKYLLTTFSTVVFPILWDVDAAEIVDVEFPHFSYSDWNEAGVIGIQYFSDVFLVNPEEEIITRVADVTDYPGGNYVQWSPSGSYFAVYIDPARIMICPFGPRPSSTKGENIH